MAIRKLRRDPTVKVRRRDLGPLIANAYGPVQMRTLIYRSTSRGEQFNVLEKVDGASVDVSNFRETTWEISIGLDRSQEFNPLKDWLKVVIEIYVDGVWKRYNRGVYKFTEKAGSINRSQNKWDLQGYSAELLLHEDGPLRVYTVPKNVYILNAVRDIIVARGFSSDLLLFPWAEDKLLPQAVMFDPVEDESKATWLRICNRLLGMGGFHALWVDENGKFTTDQLRDIQAQEPIVHYGPDFDQEPIILDGVSEVYDMENFANRVVVTSEDPKQIPPIFAVAVNANPNSEGSYQALGNRWVTRRIKRETISDNAAALLVAKTNLQAASSFAHVLSYSTPPDPERGLKEYHHIKIPVEGGDDIDHVFRNVGWSQEVYPQPLEMNFESSRREMV